MKAKGIGVAFAVVAAIVAAPAYGQLFSSSMDDGAAWAVNGTDDTAATFGWDFTTMGIPPSPGGSTTGLKLEANMSSGSAQKIVATPIGITAQGQYTVEFDFWVNVNGPLPLGGTGSTEFIGGGVGYDGVSAERNGALILIDGEGGSSRDYRMYKDTSEQFVASGQYDVDTNNNSGTDLSAFFPSLAPPQFQQDNYPQQTGMIAAGSGGFAWHHMLITVNGGAGTANFSVDGLSIGTLDTNIGNPVATTGAVQVMYADLFSSVSDNPELSFGVIDNFTMTPEPASLTLLALGGLAVLRRRR